MSGIDLALCYLAIFDSLFRGKNLNIQWLVHYIVLLDSNWRTLRIDLNPKLLKLYTFFFPLDILAGNMEVR